MTIAPVIKTVDVKCAPARAFELFTGRMGAWWPASHHIGGTPFAAVVIEPTAGGRWFERGEDGAETPWGKVLVWAPPSRVVLAWQLRADWTYDPDFETELEITFQPHGEGARVRVEHRNLERFGAEAAAIAESLGGGWPTIVDGFAAFADQSAKAA
jgi:uncharacterized protein YndB with AHSA1/START domain